MTRRRALSNGGQSVMSVTRRPARPGRPTSGCCVKTRSKRVSVRTPGDENETHVWRADDLTERGTDNQKPKHRRERRELELGLSTLRCGFCELRVRGMVDPPAAEEAATSQRCWVRQTWAIGCCVGGDGKAWRAKAHGSYCVTCSRSPACPEYSPRRWRSTRGRGAVMKLHRDDLPTPAHRRLRRGASA